MAGRRHPDRILIHQAKLDGAARRVRAVVWRGRNDRQRPADQDPTLEERLRADWPGLWEAIDGLIEVLDHPPPAPGGHPTDVRPP